MAISRAERPPRVAKMLRLGYAQVSARCESGWRPRKGNEDVEHRVCDTDGGTLESILGGPIEEESKVAAYTARAMKLSFVVARCQRTSSRGIKHNVLLTQLT